MRVQYRPLFSLLFTRTYLYPAGSECGGEIAASFYSLIETCKLNKINPQDYLADVLSCIADHSVNIVEQLLPHNWTPPAKKSKHHRKSMVQKTEVQIIYDEKCPFCRNYTHLIRLQKNYAVTLIDARATSEITNAIKDKHGINFDEGMVVKINNDVYFGADAMHIISILSTKSGRLNRIVSFIFKSKRASYFLYFIFKGIRKFTLWILRIPLINDQKY